MSGELIVATIGLSIVIVGGYTTLVFKLASLTSAVNQSFSTTLEVRNIVTKQDETISNIDTRLTILETVCNVKNKGVIAQ